MWSRLTGKSTDKTEESFPPISRRRTDENPSHSRRRSGSESIVSSSSSRKPPRGDDRDRGINPISSSYAPSSRSTYPAPASASIASSYATASSNRPDASNLPPGIVSGSSVVERLPHMSDERNDRYKDTARESNGRRDQSTSRERKRDRRDRSRSRDRDGKKRDKKNRREKKDRTRGLERGMSKFEDGDAMDVETSRVGDYPAPSSGNFNSQVGGAGFTQFPGQYDAGLPGVTPSPSHAPSHAPAPMSSHVPDQFPGQFPSQSAAPYRPPLSKEEGGPGLAADYYGDQGESVAHQPGVRPQPPALIVGAEPHLQAASAVVAPPVEPSASGGVGAAAEFFAGGSTGDTYQQPAPSSGRPSKPGKPSRPNKADRTSSTSTPLALAGTAALGYAAANIGSNTPNYSSTSNGMPYNTQVPGMVMAPAAGSSSRPITSGIGRNNYHSASAPVIPTLGAAAAGAAAGYVLGHQSSSPNAQNQHHSQSVSSLGGGYVNTSTAHPPTQSGFTPLPSYSGRPPSSGKQSSQSNIPLYVAGAVGAAGLAAAAHNHNHQASEQISASGAPYPSANMAYKQRSRGPFSKFVDFWKDPEGVGQFEEYTEYIGVCRQCFPPNSSPRNAPRKHHYRKRRSNDRYGSNTRVDKESRYWSSDGESRRKGNKTWIATGIAGYGLAKVGQSLWNNEDFDDTYSVKSGRAAGRASGSNLSLFRRNSYSPERKSLTSHGITRRSSDGHSRQRSRSRERVEIGITKEGSVYKKDPHDGVFGGPTTTTIDTRRRRSRTRSRSRDRRNGVTGAALGAVIGASVAGSHSRHRSSSTSPKRAFIREKWRSPEQSRHHSSSPQRDSVRNKRNNRDSSPSLGSIFGFTKSKSRRSTHISPLTSYVDISRSHRGSSTGVGGFFSAPSEKRHKTRTKKKKGFFSFGNASSSSSDQDLAFGGGFDRLQDEKEQRIKQRDRRDTAAIVGLGAAAAALAANASRNRKHGRPGAEVVAVRESRGNYHNDARNGHRSRYSSSSSMSNDEGWESASDDGSDSSGVDSDLAFGKYDLKGKGPARMSQESLPSDSSGTGKWGWRWGSKKKKERQNTVYPSDSVSHANSFIGPAAAGLVGAAAGAALSSTNRPAESVVSNTSSLPPLQHVYPMPTSDPSNFDVTRHGSTSSAQTQPLMTSRPAAVPLQQPQPITPVSSAVYSSQPPYQHSYTAPSGPPVFSDFPTPIQNSHVIAQSTSSVHVPQDFGPITTSQYEVRQDSFSAKPADQEPSPRRRDSSPTYGTSYREERKTGRRERPSTPDQASGVRFDFTKEQREREERDRRRREKEEEERRDQVRRRKAEEQALIGQERERARLQSEREAAEHASRDAETRERDFERFEREKRESEEQKQADTWVAPVVAGAVVAGMGAFVADEINQPAVERPERSNEDRQSEEDQFRYDAGKKTNNSERGRSETMKDDKSRQASIARKATAKVIEHEDYGAFFTPPELLSQSEDRAKELIGPNADNDITTYETPQIITIEPAARPRYSQPYGYPGLVNGIEPSALSSPWGVPRLRLIEPTPPGSIAGSVKDVSSAPASPVIGPEDANRVGPAVKAKSPTTTSDPNQEDEVSRNTVESSFSPREEYFVSSGTSSHQIIDEREEANFRGDSTEHFPQAPLTTDEIEDHVPGAFGDDRGFSATLAAGLEGTGFDPSIVMNDPSYRERASPSGSEQYPPGKERHSPGLGTFGDDLEFAATLAAGLEDTGFDPSIVIDNPSYRRRDSPPGSEEPQSYQSAFTETILDMGLGFDSPQTEGAPPQRGYVEGEVPETPRDVAVPGGYFEEADPQQKPSAKEGTMEQPVVSQKHETYQKDYYGPVTPPGVDVFAEPESYSEEPASSTQKPEREDVPRDLADYIDSTGEGMDPRDVEPPLAMPVAEETAQSSRKFKSKISKRRTTDVIQDVQLVDEADFVASSKKEARDNTSEPHILNVDPRDVEPVLVGAATGAMAAVGVNELKTKDREIGPITPPADNTFNDLDERPSTKKTKRKSKRDSNRFDTSTPGSPLRSEVDMDDYVDATETITRKSRESDIQQTQGQEEELAATTPLPKSVVDDFEEPRSSRSKKSKRGKDPFESLRAAPETFETEEPASLEASFNDFEIPKKSKSKKSKHGNEIVEPQTQSIDSAETAQEAAEEPRKSKSKVSRRESERYGSPDREVESVVSEAVANAKKIRKRSKSKYDDEFDDTPRSQSKVIASVVPEPALDEYERRKSKSKKSNMNSEIHEVPESDSPSIGVSQTVEDDFEQPRKSKKKGKRGTLDEDDLKSMTSSSTSMNDTEDSMQQSKDGKKGGFSSLFGVGKSSKGSADAGRSSDASPKSIFDVVEMSKSSKKGNHRESSRGVFDGVSGAANESTSNMSEIGSIRSNGNTQSEDDEDRKARKARRKQEKQRSREQSVDESGTITQDQTIKDLSLTDVRESGNTIGTEDITHIIADVADSSASNTFPNIIDHKVDVLDQTVDTQIGPAPLQLTPLVPETEIQSFKELVDTRPELTPLPGSRSTSPFEVGSANDLPPLPVSRSESPTQPSTPSKRRLSLSTRSTSSTAVPFHFRRPPQSPGFNRSSPMNSPGGLPQSSPASAPRQRQPRPRSTEFKPSSEFRPLYLVEMHRAKQEPEEEEQYPPLPSSKGSSILDPEEDQVREDLEADVVERDPGYPHDLKGLGINTESSEHRIDDSDEPPPRAMVFPQPGQETLTTDTSRQPSQEDISLSPSDTPNRIVSSVRDLFPAHQSITSLHRDDFPSEDLPPLPQSRPTSPSLAKSDQTSVLHGLQDVAVSALVGATAATVTQDISKEHESRTHTSSPVKESTSLKDEPATILGMNEHVNTRPESVNEAIALPKPQLDKEVSEVSPDQTNQSVSEEPLSIIASENIGDLDQSQHDIFDDSYVAEEPDTYVLARSKSKKKDKKGKKESRTSTVSSSEVESLPQFQNLPSLGKSQSEILTPEEKVQLQERDAQDAVDSWFAPQSSNKLKSKKDKRGKKGRSMIANEGLDSLPISPSVDAVTNIPGENLASAADEIREMEEAPRDLPELIRRIAQESSTANLDRTWPEQASPNTLDTKENTMVVPEMPSVYALPDLPNDQLHQPESTFEEKDSQPASKQRTSEAESQQPTRQEIEKGYQGFTEAASLDNIIVPNVKHDREVSYKSDPILLPEDTSALNQIPTSEDITGAQESPITTEPFAPIITTTPSRKTSKGKRKQQEDEWTASTLENPFESASEIATPIQQEPPAVPAEPEPMFTPLGRKKSKSKKKGKDSTSSKSISSSVIDSPRVLPEQVSDPEDKVTDSYFPIQAIPELDEERARQDEPGTRNVVSVEEVPPTPVQESLETESEWAAPGKKKSKGKKKKKQDTWTESEPATPLGDSEPPITMQRLVTAPELPVPEESKDSNNLPEDDSAQDPLQISFDNSTMPLEPEPEYSLSSKKEKKAKKKQERQRVTESELVQAVEDPPPNANRAVEDVEPEPKSSVRLKKNKGKKAKSGLQLEEVEPTSDPYFASTMPDDFVASDKAMQSVAPMVPLLSTKDNLDATHEGHNRESNMLLQLDHQRAMADLRAYPTASILHGEDTSAEQRLENVSLPRETEADLVEPTTRVVDAQKELRPDLISLPIDADRDLMEPVYDNLDSAVREESRVAKAFGDQEPEVQSKSTDREILESLPDDYHEAVEHKGSGNSSLEQKQPTPTKMMISRDTEMISPENVPLPEEDDLDFVDDPQESDSHRTEPDRDLSQHNEETSSEVNPNLVALPEDEDTWVPESLGQISDPLAADKRALEQPRDEDSGTAPYTMPLHDDRVSASSIRQIDPKSSPLRTDDDLQSDNETARRQHYSEPEMQERSILITDAQAVQHPDKEIMSVQQVYPEEFSSATSERRDQEDKRDTSLTEAQRVEWEQSELGAASSMAEENFEHPQQIEEARQPDDEHGVAEPLHDQSLSELSEPIEEASRSLEREHITETLRHQSPFKDESVKVYDRSSSQEKGFSSGMERQSAGILQKDAESLRSSTTIVPPEASLSEIRDDLPEPSSVPLSKEPLPVDESVSLIPRNMLESYEDAEKISTNMRPAYKNVQDPVQDSANEFPNFTTMKKSKKGKKGKRPQGLESEPVQDTTGTSSNTKEIQVERRIEPQFKSVGHVDEGQDIGIVAPLPTAEVQGPYVEDSDAFWAPALKKGKKGKKNKRDRETEPESATPLPSTSAIEDQLQAKEAWDNQVVQLAKDRQEDPISDATAILSPETQTPAESEADSIWAAPSKSMKGKKAKKGKLDEVIEPEPATFLQSIPAVDDEPLQEGPLESDANKISFTEERSEVSLPSTEVQNPTESEAHNLWAVPMKKGKKDKKGKRDRGVEPEAAPSLPLSSANEEEPLWEEASRGGSNDEPVTAEQSREIVDDVAISSTEVQILAESGADNLSAIPLKKSKKGKKGKRNEGIEPGPASLPSFTSANESETQQSEASTVDVDQLRVMKEGPKDVADEVPLQVEEIQTLAESEADSLWNAPPKKGKKGKKSKQKQVWEAEVDTSTLSSTSMEKDVPIDDVPQPETSQDFGLKKSKKDKKKDKKKPTTAYTPNDEIDESNLVPDTQANEPSTYDREPSKEVKGEATITEQQNPQNTFKDKDLAHPTSENPKTQSTMEEDYFGRDHQETFPNDNESNQLPPSITITDDKGQHASAIGYTKAGNILIPGEDENSVEYGLSDDRLGNNKRVRFVEPAHNPSERADAEIEAYPLPAFASNAAEEYSNVDPTMVSDTVRESSFDEGISQDRSIRSEGINSQTEQTRHRMPFEPQEHLLPTTGEPSVDNQASLADIVASRNPFSPEHNSDEEADREASIYQAALASHLADPVIDPEASLDEIVKSENPFARGNNSDEEADEEASIYERALARNLADPDFSLDPLEGEKAEEAPEDFFEKSVDDSDPERNNLARSDPGDSGDFRNVDQAEQYTSTKQGPSEDRDLTSGIRHDGLHMEDQTISESFVNNAEPPPLASAQDLPNHEPWEEAKYPAFTTTKKSRKGKKQPRRPILEYDDGSNSAERAAGHEEPHDQTAAAVLPKQPEQILNASDPSIAEEVSGDTPVDLAAKDEAYIPKDNDFWAVTRKKSKKNKKQQKQSLYDNTNRDADEAGTEMPITGVIPNAPSEIMQSLPSDDTTLPMASSRAEEARELISVATLSEQFSGEDAVSKDSIRLRGPDSSLEKTVHAAREAGKVYEGAVDYSPQDTVRDTIIQPEDEADEPWVPAAKEKGQKPRKGRESQEQSQTSTPTRSMSRNLDVELDRVPASTEEFNEVMPEEDSPSQQERSFTHRPFSDQPQDLAPPQHLPNISPNVQAPPRMDPIEMANMSPVDLSDPGPSAYHEHLNTELQDKPRTDAAPSQPEKQSPVTSMFPWLKRVSAKPPSREKPHLEISTEAPTGVIQSTGPMPSDEIIQPSERSGVVTPAPVEVFDDSTPGERYEDLQSSDFFPERRQSFPLSRLGLQKAEPESSMAVAQEQHSNLRNINRDADLEHDLATNTDEQSLPERHPQEMGRQVDSQENHLAAATASAAAAFVDASVAESLESRKAKRDAEKNKKRNAGGRYQTLEDSETAVELSEDPFNHDAFLETPIQNEEYTPITRPFNATHERSLKENAKGSTMVEPENLSFGAPHPPSASMDDGQLTHDESIVRAAEEVRYSQHTEFDDLESIRSPEEPTSSTSEARTKDYPAAEALPSHRDSAVHVSDTPFLSNSPLEHNAVRDSGYHDPADSPQKHHIAEVSPRSRTGTPQPISFTRTRSPYQPPEETTVMQEHPTQSQLSYNNRQISGTNTSSSDPLNISVEIDPSYELSVSRHRPRQHDQSDRDSSRSVEVEWNPMGSSTEVSALEQRLRDGVTPMRSIENFQPPSPVESTTKDRDSMLFEASPPVRDVPGHSASIGANPEVHCQDQSRDLQGQQRVEPRDDGIYEHARSSAYHPDSIKVNPAFKEENLINPTSSPTTAQGPTTSLFGGPLGVNSDNRAMNKSPRTPLNTQNVDRSLKTIIEQSPDSPSIKKSRAISDKWVPQNDNKSSNQSTNLQHSSSDRLHSPLSQPPTVAAIPHSEPNTGDKKPLSTDEILNRLSWPAVDENDHTVDIERAKSRDTDHRPSSRHSNVSAITDPSKRKESERRSASGHSIRSNGDVGRDGDSHRSVSGLSNRSSTSTPPLRRVDRNASGDLRAANKRSQAKLAKDREPEHHPLESSSTYDPVKDKGKGRARDMADVYQGWGDVSGSPFSPTRPPSMRRRQSMQILDLETKVDQLASENRLLQDAKSRAEKGLEDVAYSQKRGSNALSEAIETRDLRLREKDSEIDQLKQTLQWIQGEVKRLVEVNQGLTTTNGTMSSQHDERYSTLQAEHANTHQQWQQSTRELEDLRQEHNQLSTGMDNIVKHEINVALADKNVEIERLCRELEIAKQQVRALQQQILASKPSENLLIARDEDYFDGACQQLCQHVQQWVLRFSKFSDNRGCRLVADLDNSNTADRFENTILDGSDVDNYLADRVKRRDVFMSVVMTMVWEYVFTRYLFGMDREQRQKLKSLEKILAEVGPMKAVHRWRATTLTLLSKRNAFQAQRAQDTEAIVQEIYNILSAVLPPPSQLERQIQESLRKVMTSAVDLSIEMRTQRAEYIMLPPLQPEWDTNGDLAQTFPFNASLMNERSGDTTSNDDLQAQQAVVRMVLFPLVVKKGDDDGVGDEEIVVCPAQVLVAKQGKEKKVVRVLSGERMDMDHPNKSMQSIAPSTIDMGNMI
ncbi:MAG: hypothetical protein M1827_004898 [Pycnora praestabilis]|nr:MAG: hypothetical protein M1827_004898 [Pycnora praestabilis]